MNAHNLSAMTADKMTELGAGIVRLAFGWDVIEPNCKGCYTWERTDGWRDEAKRTVGVINAQPVESPDYTVFASYEL